MCEGACAPPVGHAHDDVLHALLRRLVNNGLQRRDERLAALQAKAFLCRPLLLEELFEPARTGSGVTQLARPPGVHEVAPLRPSPGGADHPGQQRPLLLQGELHDAWRLKLLPDPLALLQVIDEHELHADVLAVGHLEQDAGERRHRSGLIGRRPIDPATGGTHLQAADDLLQRQHAFRTANEGGGGQTEHLVQVRLVKAVEACVSHDAVRETAVQAEVGLDFFFFFHFVELSGGKKAEVRW